jgi:hypothetical protein
MWRSMRRLGVPLVGALAAATLATASVPPAPAVAAPPTATFPPGVWKGAAVGTGGISGQGVDAFISEPIKYTFEVEVAPDGSVAGGTWTMTGEVAAATPGAEGVLSLGGSGTFGGTGARLAIAGSITFAGSITVQGTAYPINFTADAAGGFSPSTATCTFVTGDIATEGRAAQEAAGFATSVTGPFTAYRIGNPGAAAVPGFEEQYVELVGKADALLAQSPPPAAEVVALVQQAESFYHNVFNYSSCPGGNANLLPGKQPYTYFVKTIGALLLAALTDPTAYSVDDLSALAFAALRIGVVGSAAPDPELAGQVSQALFDALSGQLSAAAAANNQTDCVIIHITASALGFTELLADAQACAAG